MLISGVSDQVELDGSVSGYHLDRAYGSVFAQVLVSFTVQVPLHGQSKVYTGEQRIEKIINFSQKR